MRNRTQSRDKLRPKGKNTSTLSNYYFYFHAFKIDKWKANLEENDSQANYEDDDESGPSTSTRIPPQKKRNRVPKQTDLDEALLKALNDSNTIDEDTNFAFILLGGN